MIILPTVGVDDGLWNGIASQAINWIAHILFGGDDDAESEQEDDRDRVVELEDVVVYLDPAGLEQRLQTAKHVEHYACGYRGYGGDAIDW